MLGPLFPHTSVNLAPKFKFAWMPFGGGAHKCIGMHFANMIVKCFMHQFLLKYEWTLPDNYSPKMESFPLPKTADGLPVILKKIA